MVVVVVIVILVAVAVVPIPSITSGVGLLHGKKSMLKSIISMLYALLKGVLTFVKLCHEMLSLMMLFIGD